MNNSLHNGTFHFVCYDCGKEHDPATLAFRCTCGGMLDVADFQPSFTLDTLDPSEWSLFRYRRALPFDERDQHWRKISMGEGVTPIVPLDQNHPHVLVKMDYLMPTLSFKDRGAVIVMAKAMELGVKRVIQDSSGNAGTSIAAYARRAGIKCDIYVPASTSAKKVKQIHAHGAQVHLIEGNREKTAQAALEAVEGGESFYASHVYNPFFYQGTKTYVYEVYEQLSGTLPDVFVVPVGNGTLLLGVYYGLMELQQAGLINHLPRIMAVQSEKCAPIYQAYATGASKVAPVENSGTLAEGIAIAAPKRGSQILEAIRKTNGFVVTAPEDKIEHAKRTLAEKGFYVEPTTAATFAGYDHYLETQGGSLQGTVVLPLCGAGLKADS